MNTYAIVAGRALIGLLFLVSGITKALGIEGVASFIASAGLPMSAVLVYLVIILEVVAGTALILGWKTKYAAWTLILFVVVTTVIFHLDFSVSAQVTAFLKNMAVTGGLLYVLVHGPGSIALDTKRTPVTVDPITS